MSESSGGSEQVRPLGHVAVVGAGQVGTMIGVRLRAADPAAGVAEVGLVDRNAGAAERSLARGAGDRVLASLGEALEADSMVIALPVPEIVRLLKEVGPRLRPGTFIIDTGSAKAIVAEAMHRLPTEVRAVGGHPIAGTERPGPDGADPDRLLGAPFALTPVRPDDEALALGRALVEAVGARPVVLDPDEHDRIVARSSHLPHLVAYALKAAAGPALGDHELVGSGYRGATRLADSDPGMVAGFLSANAGEVRTALAELRVVLDRLEAGLAAGPGPLADVLADAAGAHTRVSPR
jgi:prephenate dehydrogenase